MRRKWSRLISLWLVLLILAGQTAFAAVPKMNAAITKSNVLSLMNAYDKDSAYLLNQASEGGDGFLIWWAGCRQIAEGVDVGVHEEFHGYSYMHAPYNSEDIYIGSGKTIRVPITSVFRSRRMGATIPAALRTARWSDYVGRPDSNMASDVQGVYGLLNEFTAYYWGMHAQLALFDYYRENNATVSQWRYFVNMCANDRLAYAEFKYYILNYLVYAKQNDRSVYNGILKNENFLTAYQKIEKKFAELNRQFEKRLTQICRILEARGYRTSVGEGFFVSGYGYSIFQSDYNRLIKELKKAKYQNILKTGDAKTTVGGTAITSLDSEAKGISIKWKKADNADGYLVYRKTQGESSYKKVRTTSALSWTDTGVKRGRQYSYKVVPYAKSGSGSVTRGTASAVKQLRR